MSGSGFDPSGSLPVGITKSVPEATQPLDHRRASTKNALEVLIGVLAWREFQLLGSHTIKLVDIGGVAVIHPCPIKNQLAHSLKQTSCHSDGALWITIPSFQSFLPGGM